MIYSTAGTDQGRPAGQPMFLFFDTETTGLPPHRDVPLSDARHWPRLVQIAWLLTEAGGNELRQRAFVIRPEGFEIPLSAVRIHGITTELARRVGVGIRRVLDAFAADLWEATVVVAHNIRFDEGVVGAEFLRAGRPNPLEAKARVCTMRAATDFCRIPGGPRGYKWPTLDELHRVLFGTPPGSSHDARTDVRACARCFFELRRRGVIR